MPKKQNRNYYCAHYALILTFFPCNFLSIFDFSIIMKICWPCFYLFLFLFISLLFLLIYSYLISLFCRLSVFPPILLTFHFHLQDYSYFLHFFNTCLYNSSQHLTLQNHINVYRNPAKYSYIFIFTSSYKRTYITYK